MNEVESLDEARERSFLVMVWGWLVFLLLAWLAVFSLNLPGATTAVIILGIASIKAGLLLRNYMSLKGQHILIYLLVAVPILLVIFLFFAFMPDVVFRYHMGS